MKYSTSFLTQRHRTPTRFLETMSLTRDAFDGVLQRSPEWGSGVARLRRDYQSGELEKQSAAETRVVNYLERFYIIAVKRFNGGGLMVPLDGLMVTV